MNRIILTLALLAPLSFHLALAEPAQKPNWPKGIDPASLILNSDHEPDLSQPGLVDLFNGTDLSGWSVQGTPMKFEARDGVVVGTCDPSLKGNGFLCTDKTYTDFLFTTEFKWEVVGNSGIMFRAATREVKNREHGQVFGYQSEMDPTDRRWTGGIYGEAMGGWKYPLTKPEEHVAAREAITDVHAWNRMTILARGDVIQTWINGVPCSHLVNDERDEGYIGLQVHAGPKGTILWRNIKLKELR